MLKIDQGGVYESSLVDFCAKYEIIDESTTPYSPQSNRMTEQKKPHFKVNDECNVNKFISTTKHMERSHFEC